MFRLKPCILISPNEGILKIGLFVTFLILQFALAFKAEAGDQTACKKSALPIVGACFKIHGRLTAYNGNPSLRIWVVGTHHLLGITESDGFTEDMFPEDIRLSFKNDPFSIAVYGDYEVCPLSHERPHEMQDICVMSASNLVARPFHGLHFAMPHYSPLKEKE